MNNEFTGAELDSLREKINSMMSDFRLAHTLGVEKMATKLGELYCPDKISDLRAAALLHDITKEYSLAEQMEVFNRCGVKAPKEAIAAPATLHSLTAALVIPQEYPVFAKSCIIDAVRYHTTGRAEMSMIEKLIYLADYIDETRKYEDCVTLRGEFFDAEPEKMTSKERITHLNRVILHSLDLTVTDLVEKGKVISSDTINARNHLIFELENEENE